MRAWIRDLWRRLRSGGSRTVAEIDAPTTYEPPRLPPVVEVSASPAPVTTRPAPTLDDRVAIEAAISGLNAANRSFSGTLETLQRLRESGASAEPVSSHAADRAFEARMEEAEIEARAYLQRAKRRADELVTTMIETIERQAEEIRAEAEAGMRGRWQAVEEAADLHLQQARQVADGMVAERQERLAALSDGITTRADTLVEGMADAGAVRAQFDGFIAALSQTAAAIADDTRQEAGEVNDNAAEPPPAEPKPEPEVEATPARSAVREPIGERAEEREPAAATEAGEDPLAA